MKKSSLKLSGFVLGGLAIICPLIIVALSQIKATHESKAHSFALLYNYLGGDIVSGNMEIVEANALNRDLVTWESLISIIKSHGADEGLVIQLEENMKALSNEILTKRKRVCEYTEELLKFQIGDVAFEEVSSFNCEIESASLDELIKAADANIIAAIKLSHRIGEQGQKESASSTLLGEWITFLAITTGICSFLSYTLISTGKH